MFCLSSFPALGSGVRAAAPEVLCCWCEKCAGLISPWAACCEPPVLRGCPQSWLGMGGPARALPSSCLTGDGQNTGTNRLRGAAFTSARQEAAVTFRPLPWPRGLVAASAGGISGGAVGLWLPGDPGPHPHHATLSWIQPVPCAVPVLYMVDCLHSYQTHSVHGHKPSKSSPPAKSC